jgi:hypothetical protein
MCSNLYIINLSYCVIGIQYPELYLRIYPYGIIVIDVHYILYDPNLRSNFSEVLEVFDVRLLGLSDKVIRIVTQGVRSDIYRKQSRTMLTSLSPIKNAIPYYVKGSELKFAVAEVLTLFITLPVSNCSLPNIALVR